VSLQTLRVATAGAAIAQVLLTAAALLLSDQVRAAAAAAFALLFFVGSFLFLWGLLVAAARSRDEDLDVGGVFFLSGGSVSGADRRWFLGSLAVQAIVGLGGAIVAPFTALAFGILVPMFGLGIVALVGAKHGSFRSK